jgi:hypothetical protein
VEKGRWTRFREEDGGAEAGWMFGGSSGKDLLCSLSPDDIDLDSFSMAESGDLAPKIQDQEEEEEDATGEDKGADYRLLARLNRSASFPLLFSSFQTPRRSCSCPICSLVDVLDPEYRFRNEGKRILSRCSSGSTSRRELFESRGKPCLVLWKGSGGVPGRSIHHYHSSRLLIHSPPLVS